MDNERRSARRLAAVDWLGAVETDPSRSTEGWRGDVGYFGFG